VTITNGYCDLDQVKQDMRISFGDLADDARLEIAIAAASRQIDAHTGRRFWQDSTVVTKQFYCDDSYTCVMDDDISTTVGLIVAADDDDDGIFETTLTITSNFLLLPLNAADRVPVWPYTELRMVDVAGAVGFPVHGSGRPGLQITAKWGWPAIPDDVTKACLIQAAQLFKAADAVFGVAQYAEAGFAMRVQNRLNPMAEALLEPYCRPRVG
jgi:hypothetical protein